MNTNRLKDLQWQRLQNQIQDGAKHLFEQITLNSEGRVKVRKSTALPRPRAEVAQSLTRDGVTAFLAELGGGMVEAEISSASPDVLPQEGIDPLAPLQVGDRVHVRLAGLQFSDLAGFAKMLAVDRAPNSAKPYVEPFLEKTRVLERLAGSLDLAYGLLRSNVEFQSVIVRMEETTEGLEWMDQGENLPRPLKSFSHLHQLIDTSEGCIMVDEISVEVSPSPLASAVEFMLRAHLEHRARVYGRLFKLEEKTAASMATEVAEAT